VNDLVLLIRSLCTKIITRHEDRCYTNKSVTILSSPKQYFGYEFDVELSSTGVSSLVDNNIRHKCVRLIIMLIIQCHPERINILENTSIFFFSPSKCPKHIEDKTVGVEKVLVSDA
jgi:hypothetical protein